MRSQTQIAVKQSDVDAAVAELTSRLLRPAQPIGADTPAALKTTYSTQSEAGE
jgi:hypothetical protein